MSKGEVAEAAGLLRGQGFVDIAVDGEAIRLWTAGEGVAELDFTVGVGDEDRNGSSRCLTRDQIESLICALQAELEVSENDG